MISYTRKPNKTQPEISYVVICIKNSFQYFYCFQSYLGRTVAAIVAVRHSNDPTNYTHCVPVMIKIQFVEKVSKHLQINLKETLLLIDVSVFVLIK